MPVVTLTDIALQNLRPTPGKQVTYIDKSLKGFGVRVNERGMSYVLTFGPKRQRIKINLGGNRVDALTINIECAQEIDRVQP